VRLENKIRRRIRLNKKDEEKRREKKESCRKGKTQKRVE